MKRYVYAEPKRKITENRKLDLHDKLATRWAIKAEKLIKTANTVAR